MLTVEKGSDCTLRISFEGEIPEGFSREDLREILLGGPDRTWHTCVLSVKTWISFSSQNFIVNWEFSGRPRCPSQTTCLRSLTGSEDLEEACDFLQVQISESLKEVSSSKSMSCLKKNLPSIPLA